MPIIPVFGGEIGISIGHTPVQPVWGGVIPIPGVPTIKLDPVQVAGLVPLIPCGTKECREICEDGIRLPVFGELIGNSYQKNPTYENDWNSFFIDISSYKANSWITVAFYLEKFHQGEWRRNPFAPDLNNNNYGILYPLGTVFGHPTYAGYDINWGAILAAFGPGCYRFKAETSFSTTITTGFVTGAIQASCVFSMPTMHPGILFGNLKTTVGSIPATYIVNQTNPAFTKEQNVAFLANLINTGLAPYTAIYDGFTSFTIYGQNYAANNGTVFKATLNEYLQTSTMAGGNNGTPITTPLVYKGCVQSPVFDLLSWDCMKAHTTVKWETWLTGLIGDPYTDYKKHDLCGILKYDSIRTYGYIQHAKSPQYLTNNLEWGAPQDGKIEKVSDEQIQRWEYNSKYLPEWLHTRFATFAMMSDRLFMSDYNRNNSDYTIKRKTVIYDSGYEPENIDREAPWKRRNKMKVQVFFKRGVQSVIKSLCCPRPIP